MSHDKLVPVLDLRALLLINAHLKTLQALRISLALPTKKKQKTKNVFSHFKNIVKISHILL